MYPLSGVDAGFHNASHHGTAEDRITQFSEINKYHVSMLPYFMERLQDDDGRRHEPAREDADHYGSPMADGNLHNHRAVRCSCSATAAGSWTAACI